MSARIISYFAAVRQESACGERLRIAMSLFIGSSCYLFTLSGTVPSFLIFPSLRIAIGDSGLREPEIAVPENNIDLHCSIWSRVQHYRSLVASCTVRISLAHW